MKEQLIEKALRTSIFVYGSSAVENFSRRATLSLSPTTTLANIVAFEEDFKAILDAFKYCADTGKKCSIIFHENNNYNTGLMLRNAWRYEGVPDYNATEIYIPKVEDQNVAERKDISVYFNLPIMSQLANAGI